MTNIATEPIAHVRQSVSIKNSENKLPVIRHLIDHLQCAAILARQVKLDTTAYLIDLAIAASRENTLPDKKRC
jgi:hypothetical protein